MPACSAKRLLPCDRAARCLVAFLLLTGFTAALPPASAQAQVSEENVSAADGITGNVLGEYRDLALEWDSRLGAYGRALFFSLLTIQGLWFLGKVILGIYRGRPEEGIEGRFVKFLFFALIASLLVVSSEQWIDGIYDGFVWTADLATGRERPPDPGAVAMQGFSLAYEVNAVEDETASGRNLIPGMFEASDLDGASPSNNIVWWASVGIVVSFIGIAIQLFITEAAFFLTLGAAPFFLAWAGFRPTAGLAEGFLKFALYVCVKMLILLLLGGVAADMPLNLAQLFTESTPDADAWGWIGDIPGVNLVEDYYEYVAYRARVATSMLVAVLCTAALVIAVPRQFASMVTRSVRLGISDMLDF